jgi:hypothetical protein
VPSGICPSAGTLRALRARPAALGVRAVNGSKDTPVVLKRRPPFLDSSASMISCGSAAFQFQRVARLRTAIPARLGMVAAAARSYLLDGEDVRLALHGAPRVGVALVDARLVDLPLVGDLRTKSGRGGGDWWVGGACEKSRDRRRSRGGGYRSRHYAVLQY